MEEKTKQMRIDRPQTHRKSNTTEQGRRKTNKKKNKTTPQKQSKQDDDDDEDAEQPPSPKPQPLQPPSLPVGCATPGSQLAQPWHREGPHAP